MRSINPLDSRDLRLPIKITLDARVFEHIVSEANKYPNAEEGGKYIGKMHGPDGEGELSVLVTDFLPGGPRAKRTSVEFLPDGEYQEAMFRTIERVDPEVEHLGSWHTHHCNGLDRLSPGDINGYFRTVNKKAYRPRVFIASLVKFIPSNPNSEGWINHFLFVRGDDRFYDVTKRIEVVESGWNYGKWTGHETHESVRVSTGPWFDSEVGRQTLAEDRKFFGSAFSKVASTLRKGQIRTRCERAGGCMTVMYPARHDESQVTIDVATGPQTVLTLYCDLGCRKIAFVAAIAALEYQ